MKSNEKLLLGILAGIVLFCVFSISFYAIRTSNDEFWHIKTGEYIVQNGYKLPQNDIFTYTASDMPWVNHEWLSQILFYHIYDFSGFKGFVLFKSILILIAFIGVYFVVYQRCKNHYIALFAVLLGALTSRHTLYPRPYIFSYLFVPIYLYFLYELTEKGIKKRHYWIFPLIMVFWVNLHGGSILGFISIGFFLSGEIIQFIYRRFIKKNQINHLPIIRALALIFIITLIVSFINPYGFKVFELTTKVMTDKGLVASIGELQPPDFRFTTYYLAMLIITGLSVIVTWRKLTLPDLFLLIFFGQQSLCHVRHLPLFGITAAPIFGKHLKELSTTIERYLTPLKSISRTDMVCSLTILILAFNILVLQGQLSLNMEMLQGPGYRVNNYPVRAANFILQNDFHGNMFNEINFAGYLMFALYPKHKVFTDNRFDIWGSKFLPDFYEINEIGPRWKETLDKYKINFIITEQSSKLRIQLEESNDWVRVYLDSGYAIFVKNIPENEELIKRCRQNMF